MKEYGVEDIPMVGVAKGVDRDAGKEEFYRVNQRPMALRHNDPVLYFIQRLRDEAHRFANTFNADLRSRKIRESILEDFPGLGPVRRTALLDHFGSIERLRGASVTALNEVPGIGSKFAVELHRFLAPDNPTSTPSA